jgi:hypothetical protein
MSSKRGSFWKINWGFDKETECVEYIMNGFPLFELLYLKYPQELESIWMGWYCFIISNNRNSFSWKNS